MNDFVPTYERMSMTSSTVPINDISPRAQYVATAGQTAFPFTFWLPESTDMAVYHNGTLLTLGTDYSISGVGTPTGGTVTLTTGAALNDTVILSREIAFARTAEFQSGGTFQASVLNAEQSREIAMLQQLKRDLGRKFGINTTATYTGSLNLPDAQGGTLLGWNASGTGLTNYTTAPYSAPNGALIPALDGADAHQVTVVNGTASGFAVLPAGTAGQVLTSAGNAAPTWQTPEAQAVKQVVYAAGSGSDQTTNSTAFAAFGAVSAAITPTSAANSVLVELTMAISVQDDGAGGIAALRLLRGSTVINSWTNVCGHGTATTQYTTHRVCLRHLDSPATTSAQTYSLEIARTSGAATVRFHGSSEPLNLTLTEISA